MNDNLDPSQPAVGRLMRVGTVIPQNALRQEANLGGAVALSPEEAAQNQAHETSPAVKAQLEQAIAATSDPNAQAALKETYDRDFGAQAQPAAGASAATKPPTWDEVLKLPEMQKLPTDQLEAARSQYFLDVVAPQIPTEQLGAARAAFDGDTKPGPITRTVKAMGDAVESVRNGTATDSVVNAVRSGVKFLDEKLAKPRIQQPEDQPLNRTFQERVQGYLDQGFDAKLAGKFTNADMTAGIDSSNPPEKLEPSSTKLVNELRRGFGGVVSTLDGILMAENAAVLEDKRRKNTPEQLANDPDYQNSVRAYQQYRARIDHRNRELDTLPRSSAVRKMFEGEGDEGVTNFVNAFKEDPGGAVSVIVGGSVPASLSMLAAAALARVGGFNMPVVAGAGGVASMFNEFGGDYEQNRRQGMPHDEAYNRALIKSGVIGTFDAVSLGSAGKALDEIAKVVTKTGAVKQAAKTYVKESGKQAALGAGGETYGSVLSGAMPQPGQVAAEAMGEFLLGVPQGIPAMGGKQAGAVPGAASAGETEPAKAPSKQPVAAGPVSAEDLLGKVEPAPETPTAPAASSAPKGKVGQLGVTPPAMEQGAVDQAAHAAATSLRNDLPQPSAAQEEAGNHQLGHTTISGLDISIQFPEGSTRFKDTDHPTVMKDHYGYIKRTEDKDGEQVDAYVVPGTPQDFEGNAYVVDQRNLQTGKFDEHKAVIGARSPSEAQQVYDQAFSDGSGPQRRMAVTAMPMPEFKRWVAEGDTKRPASPLNNLPPPAPAKQVGQVLQNRNRSSKSSIVQMNDIAGNPDPARLSFSRDFLSGAPTVIAGGAQIPEIQLGKTDRVITASGREVPVRYAVVEAETLLPSHDVTGAPSAGYDTGTSGRLRVIAGNGRAAGIQAGFERKTTANYIKGIAEDTALHGVSAEAIKGLRQPVLVRVMPDSEVTENIGDETNTAATAALSPAENAANDARRIDVTGLEFGEDGEITRAAAKQFVSALPDTERAGLVDHNGEPTRQAYERLTSAVFMQAYGDADLVSLQSQATDQEARAVMSAMVRAAPVMARLENAGDLDIRSIVIEAAKAAVNAKRAGVSLTKYAAQADMTLHPESAVVLRFFADNIRSGIKIGDGLINAATTAAEQAGLPANDMFGAVPRSSRAAVLARIANDTSGQEDMAQPGGAVSPGRDAGRRAAEAAGQGDNPAVEADRPARLELATQTNSEVAATERAQREAKTREEAQAKAAEARAKAETGRKEIEQRSSDVAGEFSLTAPEAVDKQTQKQIDAKAAEDQLAGQADIFSQPAKTAASAIAGALRTAADAIEGAAKPAESNTPEDQRIREIMGLDRAKIAAYDPEKSVEKTGRHWSYNTINGNSHPGIYDTKREAIESATRHKQMQLDQYDNPSDFYDVTALIAGERLKLMKKYEAAGMPEMEAGQKAREEIPDTNPAAQPAATPQAEGQAIEDFGEKIGGARKDTAQPLGARIKADAEESAEPGWRKRFSVSQIAASSRENEVGLWTIHDERKKDWHGRARQVGGTFATKEAAEAAIPLLAVAQKHRAVPVRVETAPMTEAQVDAMLARDSAAMEVEHNRPGRTEYMVMESGRKKLAAGTITAEQFKNLSDKYAEAAKQYAPPATPVIQPDRVQAYEIWRDVTDRKRVKVVDQQFATRDDAMRYMAEHAVEIIETKTGFGEEILAKPDVVKRTGVARRTGPATTKMFTDAFGFRAVEFGLWNNQDERQEVMNHAYDGLLDLADVLNVPAKALSLNGELALAFGARGQGLSGAKAHYETDYGVINLTKMTGAGSLAHEWLHAADHYFARQDTKAKSEKVRNARGDLVYPGATDRINMASHGFRAVGSQVRPELRAAYENLIQTMFTKAEQYVEDTQRAEKFVGDARERLAEALKEIRTNLTRGPEQLTHMKRNNKPASAEQLATFDQLADKLIAGQDLETKFILNNPDLPANRRGSMAGRNSNDTLDAMSAIFKAVRGRQGFTADNTGPLDGLRYLVKNYRERIKMLESANANETKTKRVPTSYAMENKKIDQGRASDYWTTPHEMAARAFSAYVEDKVAEQGNQSDFLAYGSDNKFYRLFNIRPFPEGAERVAINAAFDKFIGEIQTKETATGTAMLSRTYRGPALGSMKAEDVKAVAAIFQAKLKGIPAIHVLEGQRQAPEALRRDIRQLGGEDDTAGAWHDGEVYLFADNLHSPEHAAWVILHEGTHHGLRGMFGTALNPVLMDIYLKNREVRAATAREKSKNPKLSTVAAVEEVLANMGADGVPQSVMEIIVAAVRRLIRSLGIKLDVTDSDVKDLVARALAFVKKPPRGTQIMSGSALHTAWHGSPHDFDEFKLNKIGTGEGAQAYGWGMYFAGNKDVAEFYKGKLSDISLERNGKRMDPAPFNGTPEETAYGYARGRLLDELRYLNIKHLDGESIALSARSLAGDALENAKKYNDPSAVKLERMIAKNLNQFADEARAGTIKAAKGRLYQVDLTPKEDEYLDWDKPLTEQSDTVKSALKKLPQEVEEILIDRQNVDLKEAVGRQLYGALRYLADEGGIGDNLDFASRTSEEEASRYLASIGIPGIRYLDGASRGKSEGTHNYVIFDDKLVNITSRLSRGAGGEAPLPRGEGGEISDEPTRRSYKQWSTDVVDTLDSWLEPIGRLPEKQKYLAQRYEALGKIAKVDEMAAELGKVFADATDADKQAAYDYFITRDAIPDAISDEGVRTEAERVKKNITYVGDALVERGMLSKEAHEQYRDAYLPRLYLKHLLTEGDWKALGAGKKPSTLSYLKKRQDIPEEVRRVIMGEITDPGYLAAVAVAKPVRDMVLLDFLAQISKQKDWTLPGALVEWGDVNLTKPAATPDMFGMPTKKRLVSAYWLRDEAARLRKQATYYEADTAKRALEIAAEMDGAADVALDALDVDHKKFRQIPDAPRYGRLRGIWVRNEIYDDLMGINDFMPTNPGWFQSLLGYGGIGTTITQIWKTGKVALNPPSQVRNFVSNAVLLQLSGVSLPKVPVRVIQAWREIQNNGPHWKVAQKFGVTASTFAAQELYRAKRDLLDLEKRMGTLSTFGKLHHIAAKVFDIGGDFYQKMEALFKTAKIIDAMVSKGMNAEEAALEAQKWLFDYSLVAKEVRYARNAPIGAPFLTFQVKVLPRLVEVALKHPQRYLPWAALLYGMQFGLAAMMGVDDDDLDKLKKALPEWLHDRGHTMLLPYKDERGRWQVLDLGYFFPWTQWTQLAGDIGGGEIGKAVKTAGVFSGPITDLLVAIKTGKDSFTGRDIYKPGDPAERQAISILNYLWSMAMPPFLTDMGVTGHALRAYTGETNKYGDPISTAPQAALRAFGINLYAMEPDKTRDANLARMAFEIEEVKKAARQRLQDSNLSPERRAKIESEYTDEAKRREAKLHRYMSESEVNQKLQ